VRSKGIGEGDNQLGAVVAPPPWLTLAGNATGFQIKERAIMRIWKWFGWDTKDARTERNHHNNKHSTIQWTMLMVAAVLIAAIIWL
jgi:hypothetical protein